MRTLLLAGTAIVALAVAMPASAALIDNFDGENGGAGALNYTGFANFNVTAGSVDIIGNGYFDAYAGNGLYVDTAGTTSQPGQLTTSTSFAAGTYAVILQIGGPIYAGGTSQVQVGLGANSATLNLTALTISSFSFTWTIGSSAPLVITDLGTSFNNNNIGSTLFEVAVLEASASTGVPEPATMALLGAGLLGLGLARRKRG